LYAQNSPVAKKENNYAAAESRNDFHISNVPVVRPGEGKDLSDFDHAMDLPRDYGEDLFFAVARDPHTIFTYWNINWSAIFAEDAPVDRQVHLRVCKADGTEESNIAAEPMSGSCYLPASQSREKYRVEIGYYQPQGVWNSVAISDVVTMPPDSVTPNADVDLATIPFHLSFQRLIHLFRAANGDALTEMISRLQRRAVSEEDRGLLSRDEWAILRAMDLSLDDIHAARRAFMDHAATEKLRKRAEAILGFDTTSLARGFGESSW
jgi:hypothetical protein